MPSEKPPVTFVIEADLLQQIEDFRFQHRFGSRAAAIKWLLRWSLERKPQPPPPSERGKRPPADAERS